jgi:hypothetical protein
LQGVDSVKEGYRMRSAKVLRCRRGARGAEVAAGKESVEDAVEVGRRRQG